MKILNSLADQVLRRFVPSLTAAASHCPPSSYWTQTQSRSCASGAGLQYRHRCCYTSSTCCCGSWTAWSACVA